MKTPARQIDLKDGTSVALRAFTADDVPRVADFLRSMPERDVLFFRQDIRSDEVIADWNNPVAERTTVSTVAEAGGDICGFAFVQRRNVAWLRHVGDVVAITAGPLRGKGLGTQLLREAIVAATELKLEKISAHIVVEDRDSVRVFEKLGFRHEGILLDHAKAADGTRYDLALMGLNLRKGGAALSLGVKHVDMTKRRDVWGP